MTSFAPLLAAVEAREKHKTDFDGKDLWAIGKALIATCGEDGPVNEAVRFLNKKGYPDYSANYLYEVRATTEAFPPSRRHAGISFFAHSEAGNPDILDWIVDETPKGKPVGGFYIRDMVKRWRELERKERQKEFEKAKDEERRAPTPQAKQKAREKVDELRGMPEPSKHKLPRPSGELVTTLTEIANVLDLGLKAKDIVKELRKQQTTINSMRDRIDVEYIDSIVESYEEGGTIIKQIVDSLSKSRLKRFSTIKGGKAS